MAELRVNSTIASHLTEADIKSVLGICPFGAIEYNNGTLEINAACRMCRICVRSGPTGLFEFFQNDKKDDMSLSEWRGVAVYIDETKDGEPHPVSAELMGKALALTKAASCLASMSPRCAKS